MKGNNILMKSKLGENDWMFKSLLYIFCATFSKSLRECYNFLFCFVFICDSLVSVTIARLSSETKTFSFVWSLGPPQCRNITTITVVMLIIKVWSFYNVDWHLAWPPLVIALLKSDNQTTLHEWRNLVKLIIN